jgi:hypothetical protein
VLEAVAAAVSVDQLVPDTFEVEADGAVEKDIEVFERDVRRVGVQKTSQSVEGGGGGAGPLDASEIGVENDLRGHCVLVAVTGANLPRKARFTFE